MENLSIKDIKLLKTKTKIILSNKDVLEINKNVISTLNLYKGKNISLNLIKRIKDLSKQEDILDKLIKKSNVTTLTPNKVITYLKKESLDKADIDIILNRLKDLSLINEDSLIEDIISRCDYKHLGYSKIISMCYHYKISEKKIREIRKDEEREYKECRLSLISLRNRFPNKNEFQRRQSLINCLTRKGFDAYIIQELVKEFANSNKKHELNVLELDYRKLLKKFKDKVSKKDLHQKVINSLLLKGYSPSDIKEIEEKIKK